ncbi:unnamed protein product [Schistocephalus solidus]|uniref:Uncharacterized protein n=1 Tax=Schistocephalus solidus TaxID=70667 RepID=A0A183SKB9_SCHSO|nr:unnamed protein product [Schistocephalus solidus]
MLGEGIKGFLDHFHKRPFVNLVAVNFTAQCLSVADYFTYFGDHQMPQLRHLSLSLYYLPGLLLSAGIDTEVDCFPSLDDASIRFTEHCCGRPSGEFSCCSELYLSDDRLFPISLKEVYLQFYLDPIISRTDGPLRRSAIEEALLKADVGVTDLQCCTCSVPEYLLETLSRDFVTAATLKILPLLAAQRKTLVSLEISADLVFGCLTDEHSQRQVVSLRVVDPHLHNGLGYSLWTTYNVSFLLCAPPFEAKLFPK